ncbi:hypothetical protein Tcan_00129, partial [Toxocara canis]
MTENEMNEALREQREGSTRKRRTRLKRSDRKRSELLTCVTAKQMKAVLSLSDAISREEGSGGSGLTEDPFKMGTEDPVSSDARQQANTTARGRSFRMSASRRSSKRPKCS